MPTQRTYERTLTSGDTQLWLIVLFLGIMTFVQIAGLMKWEPVITTPVEEQQSVETAETCFWVIANSVENVRCAVPDESGDVEVSIPNPDGTTTDIEYSTVNDNVRINVTQPGVYPPEEE